MDTDITRLIIVYSTPLCAPCQRLKSYLSGNGIKFVAKDLMLDQEAGAFIESKGIRSSPVLQVGENLYYGDDLVKDRLDEILAL